MEQHSAKTGLCTTTVFFNVNQKKSSKLTTKKSGSFLLHRLWLCTYCYYYIITIRPIIVIVIITKF